MWLDGCVDNDITMIAVGGVEGGGADYICYLLHVVTVVSSLRLYKRQLAPAPAVAGSTSPSECKYCGHTASSGSDPGGSAQTLMAAGPCPPPSPPEPVSVRSHHSTDQTLTGAGANI